MTNSQCCTRNMSVMNTFCYCKLQLQQQGRKGCSQWCANSRARSTRFQCSPPSAPAANAVMSAATRNLGWAGKSEENPMIFPSFLGQMMKWSAAFFSRCSLRSPEKGVNKLNIRHQLGRWSRMHLACLCAPANAQAATGLSESHSGQRHHLQSESQNLG